VLTRSREAARYRLRLAESAEDVRAAQTLRFLVFNVELQGGLAGSYVTCRDADPFDEVCQHLLVEEPSTGQVVGTYRLQTGATAQQRLGFYGAGEFDLNPFADRYSEVLELGRACVLREHRNLTVLSLLWQGIAAYAQRHGTRYLLGCSSLTSQDPAAGLAFYQALPTTAHAESRWQTLPLPGFACRAEEPLPLPPPTPKLLAAYLSVGARICSPPALDRGFKTIDFLTLLDLGSLSPRTAALLATGRV
jgi:putative hemolysin